MHFSRFFRTFAVEMRESVLNIIMTVIALAVLTGCSGDKAQRLQQLEQLEQQNRSGQPMLNDSLAEDLVSYFDRHGDANERMRSRYILGRTYYCLGELPRALETYNEAADCADTTSANCDFARLSRVYAQKSDIYNKQIIPQSELKELRKAEYYAKRGKDTLMAIECYSLQIGVYKFLNNTDSVISISNKAYNLFNGINRIDRASQIAGGMITSLIKKGDIGDAYRCINEYEEYSNLLDKNGDILNGHEIYYYIKGQYYLAINDLETAELLFRKELRDGKDLNNQIAGCKGLQKVYEKRKNLDSIAKYATLSYELNDSAYSLSALQNVQKFEASYNYNHQKLIAEQKRMEAERAWFITMLVLFGVIIILLAFSKQYRTFRRAALDYRLRHAVITRRLRKMAKNNPPLYPNLDDWNDLRDLVEREIPSFSKKLNTEKYTLTDLEYDVCLLIRVQIQLSDIAKLKQCTQSYITNIRKKLLLRIFNREGSADEFDDEIGKIGN